MFLSIFLKPEIEVEETTCRYDGVWTLLLKLELETNVTILKR